MFYNQKVDFHSHYLSKTYYEYLKEYEGQKPDNFPTPNWSAESHLNLMNKLGVQFAFLSVSSPNLSKADKDVETKMVHQINIEGAELVKEHPNNFGLFASLPLPNVKEAIEEAKFVFDELHADGLGLSTHYAGVYLGDEQYNDLLKFLDERQAVIAVHPVEPSNHPKSVNKELPIPAMEFFMDTTRTFTHMVMNDIFERYPNIKWIFPHAGAFISILSDRIAGFAMQFKSSMQVERPVDFKADMRHVYFDVAGFPLNKQLHDLLLDISPKNLLYGSDTPYTPNIACIAQTGGLEKVAGLNKTSKEDVFTFNAVRLVPRLSSILNVEVEGNAICYANNPLTMSEKLNRGVRNGISKLYSKIFS